MLRKLAADLFIHTYGRKVQVMPFRPFFMDGEANFVLLAGIFKST